MTDEVKEAARWYCRTPSGRMRPVQSEGLSVLPEPILEIAHREYAKQGHAQTFERICQRGGFGIYEVIALLADAHTRLSEHPADDDEPITAEWLDRILVRSHPDCRIWALRTATIQFDTEFECFVYVHSGETLAIFRDRGDVRRLCAALGVSLK